jgi:hypothetical protein
VPHRPRAFSQAIPDLASPSSSWDAPLITGVVLSSSSRNSSSQTQPPRPVTGLMPHGSCSSAMRTKRWRPRSRR